MQAFKLLRNRRKLGDDLPEPMRRMKQDRKLEVLFMGQVEATFALTVFVVLPEFVAIYFLTTQVWDVANDIWHAIAYDDPTRNYVRDVSQVYCAAMVAGAVTFNRYYYLGKIDKPPTWWDKLKSALHIPSMSDKKPLSLGQLALTVFWCLFFATPPFIAGMYFNDYVLAHTYMFPSWLAEALDPAPKQPSANFWVNALQLFTVGWPNKLLGFLTALSTMWVARAFFLDIQEYFVAKRLQCCPRKPVHWYHTPGFQTRYNELKDNPEFAEPPAGKGTILWLRVLLWICALLTVYGWWLYYIHIPELLKAKGAA